MPACDSPARQRFTSSLPTPLPRQSLVRPDGSGIHAAHPSRIVLRQSILLAPWRQNSARDYAPGRARFAPGCRRPISQSPPKPSTANRLHRNRRGRKDDRLRHPCRITWQKGRGWLLVGGWIIQLHVDDARIALAIFQPVRSTRYFRCFNLCPARCPFCPNAISNDLLLQQARIISGKLACMDVSS